MSEGQGGEKTEQPTPKKARDARQKGQVARSQEVVTTFSLFGVIALIWAMSGGIFVKLTGLFDAVAILSLGGDFRIDALTAIDVVFSEGSGILLPILGATIFFAVAANFAQFGAIFAFDNLMPKLDKISPAAGFKRLFSMKQVVELLKSIVKIVFLSILLMIVLRGAIGPYVFSLGCGLACIAQVTSTVLAQVFAYSAIAFLIVAGFDFMFQRHTHTKSLMMSKEEVKREYKESEGDPHIKGKRKQLAQELAMGDAGNATRKSTAVVINPTHLCIAIRYNQAEMPLPMVTAKGRDFNAHYLRTQAEEAGIPVFRNVTLARALYATTEVDHYVPDELFEAVAEVLAWVAKNRELLYKGPLGHGVIDMDAGDHKNPKLMQRN